jgi:hypothetical protein
MFLIHIYLDILHNTVLVVATAGTGMRVRRRGCHVNDHRNTKFIIRLLCQGKLKGFLKVLSQVAGCR